MRELQERKGRKLISSPKISTTFYIFVMEASKEETLVAKRASREDGPVAAKRRRIGIGNHDYQNLESNAEEEIIQEKQQILQDLKVLQANKSKIEAQIQKILEDHKVLQASESKLQAQIAEKESRLNELTGPLFSKLPDEILLKILGYLSSSDVLRNVARVSKQFKKLSEDPFLIKTVELHNGLKTDDQVKGCLEVLKTSKNLKIFSFDLNWDFALPGYKKFLKALPTFNNRQASPRTRSMTREDRTPPNHQSLEEFCIRGHYWINEQYKDDYISLFGAVHK